MMTCLAGNGERGVALVVALLFLLVVTIISVVAANNSSLGLKMAANMQDSYTSFQAAEAGAVAVLALADTLRRVLQSAVELECSLYFHRGHHRRIGGAT